MFLMSIRKTTDLTSPKWAICYTRTFWTMNTGTKISFLHLAYPVYTTRNSRKLLNQFMECNTNHLLDPRRLIFTKMENIINTDVLKLIKGNAYSHGPRKNDFKDILMKKMKSANASQRNEYTREEKETTNNHFRKFSQSHSNFQDEYKTTKNSRTIHALGKFEGRKVQHDLGLHKNNHRTRTQFQEIKMTLSPSIRTANSKRVSNVNSVVNNPHYFKILSFQSENRHKLIDLVSSVKKKKKMLTPMIKEEIRSWKSSKKLKEFIETNIKRPHYNKIRYREEAKRILSGNNNQMVTNELLGKTQSNHEGNTDTKQVPTGVENDKKDPHVILKEKFSKNAHKSLGVNTHHCRKTYNDILMERKIKEMRDKLDKVTHDMNKTTSDRIDTSDSTTGTRGDVVPRGENLITEGHVSAFKIDEVCESFAKSPFSGDKQYEAFIHIGVQMKSPLNNSKLKSPIPELSSNFQNLKLETVKPTDDLGHINIDNVPKENQINKDEEPLKYLDNPENYNTVLQSAEQKPHLDKNKNELKLSNTGNTLLIANEKDVAPKSEGETSNMRDQQGFIRNDSPLINEIPDGPTKIELNCQEKQQTIENISLRSNPQPDQPTALGLMSSVNNMYQWIKCRQIELQENVAKIRLNTNQVLSLAFSNLTNVRFKKIIPQRHRFRPAIMFKKLPHLSSFVMNIPPQNEKILQSPPNDELKFSTKNKTPVTTHKTYKSVDLKNIYCPRRDSKSITLTYENTKIKQSYESAPRVRKSQTFNNLQKKLEYKEHIMTKRQKTAEIINERKSSVHSLTTPTYNDGLERHVTFPVPSPLHCGGGSTQPMSTSSKKNRRKRKNVKNEKLSIKEILDTNRILPSHILTTVNLRVHSHPESTWQGINDIMAVQVSVVRSIAYFFTKKNGKKRLSKANPIHKTKQETYLLVNLSKHKTLPKLDGKIDTVYKINYSDFLPVKTKINALKLKFANVFHESENGADINIIKEKGRKVYATLINTFSLINLNNPRKDVNNVLRAPKKGHICSDLNVIHKIAVKAGDNINKNDNIQEGGHVNISSSKKDKNLNKSNSSTVKTFDESNSTRQNKLGKSQVASSISSAKWGYTKRERTKLVKRIPQVEYHLKKLAEKYSKKRLQNYEKPFKTVDIDNNKQLSKHDGRIKYKINPKEKKKNVALKIIREVRSSSSLINKKKINKLSTTSSVVSNQKTQNSTVGIPDGPKHSPVERAEMILKTKDTEYQNNNRMYLNKNIISGSEITSHESKDTSRSNNAIENISKQDYFTEDSATQDIKYNLQGITVPSFAVPIRIVETKTSFEDQDRNHKKKKTVLIESLSIIKRQVIIPSEIINRNRGIYSIFKSLNIIVDMESTNCVSQSVWVDKYFLEMVKNPQKFAAWASMHPNNLSIFKHLMRNDYEKVKPFLNLIEYSKDVTNMHLTRYPMNTNKRDRGDAYSTSDQFNRNNFSVCRNNLEPTDLHELPHLELSAPNDLFCEKLNLTSRNNLDKINNVNYNFHRGFLFQKENKKTLKDIKFTEENSKKSDMDQSKNSSRISMNIKPRHENVQEVTCKSITHSIIVPMILPRQEENHKASLEEIPKTKPSVETLIDKKPNTTGIFSSSRNNSGIERNLIKPKRAHGLLQINNCQKFSQETSNKEVFNNHKSLLETHNSGKVLRSNKNTLKSSVNESRMEKIEIKCISPNSNNENVSSKNQCMHFCTSNENRADEDNRNSKKDKDNKSTTTSDNAVQAYIQKFNNIKLHNSETLNDLCMCDRVVTSNRAQEKDFGVTDHLKVGSLNVTPKTVMWKPKTPNNNNKSITTYSVKLSSTRREHSNTKTVYDIKCNNCVQFSSHVPPEVEQDKESPMTSLGRINQTCMEPTLISIENYSDKGEAYINIKLKLQKIDCKRGPLKSVSSHGVEIEPPEELKTLKDSVGNATLTNFKGTKSPEYNEKVEDQNIKTCNEKNKIITINLEGECQQNAIISIPSSVRTTMENLTTTSKRQEQPTTKNDLIVHFNSNKKLTDEELMINDMDQIQNTQNVKSDEQDSKMSRKLPDGLVINLEEKISELEISKRLDQDVRETIPVCDTKRDLGCYEKMNEESKLKKTQMSNQECSAKLPNSSVNLKANPTENPESKRLIEKNTNLKNVEHPNNKLMKVSHTEVPNNKIEPRVLGQAGVLRRNVNTQDNKAVIKYIKQNKETTTKESGSKREQNEYAMTNKQQSDGKININIILSKPNIDILHSTNNMRKPTFDHCSKKNTDKNEAVFLSSRGNISNIPSDTFLRREQQKFNEGNGHCVSKDQENIKATTKNMPPLQLPSIINNSYDRSHIKYHKIYNDPKNTDQSIIVSETPKCLVGNVKSENRQKGTPIEERSETRRQANVVTIFSRTNDQDLGRVKSQKLEISNNTVNDGCIPHNIRNDNITNLPSALCRENKGKQSKSPEYIKLKISKFRNNMKKATHEFTDLQKNNAAETKENLSLVGISKEKTKHGRIKLLSKENSVIQRHPRKSEVKQLNIISTDNSSKTIRSLRHIAAPTTCPSIEIHAVKNQEHMKRLRTLIKGSRKPNNEDNYKKNKEIPRANKESRTLTLNSPDSEKLKQEEIREDEKKIPKTMDESEKSKAQSHQIDQHIQLISAFKELKCHKNPQITTLIKERPIGTHIKNRKNEIRLNKKKPKKLKTNKIPIKSEVTEENIKLPSILNNVVTNVKSTLQIIPLSMHDLMAYTKQRKNWLQIQNAGNKTSQTSTLMSLSTPKKVRHNDRKPHDLSITKCNESNESFNTRNKQKLENTKKKTYMSVSRNPLPQLLRKKIVLKKTYPKKPRINLDVPNVHEQHAMRIHDSKMISNDIQKRSPHLSYSDLLNKLSKRFANT